MSINDLLEQGIQIEGKYVIKVWDSGKDDYVVYAEGEYLEDSGDIDAEECLYGEIIYMYSEREALVIEIKFEEEEW